MAATTERRVLLRAGRMLFEATPMWAAVSLLLNIASGLVPVAQLAATKAFVDGIARGQVSGAAIVALAAVTAGSRVADFWSAQSTNEVSHRVTRLAVVRFTEAASRLDLGHLDSADVYDRMRQAGEAANQRFYNFAPSAFASAWVFSALVGTVGLLASLDPAIAGLAIVSALPGLWANRTMQLRRRAFSLAATTDHRRALYLRTLVLEPEAAAEVRASNAGSEVAERHHRVMGIIEALRAPMERRNTLVVTLAGLVGAFLVLMAYLLVGRLARQGGVTPGDAAAVIGAIATITSTLRSLGSTLTTLGSQRPYLADLFSFVALAPIVHDPAAPSIIPPGPLGVTLRDVRFTYPGKTDPALVELNLTIDPGELVALVGVNGAGKSTIVRLLLRLYDPDAGSVTVNGVDLRDVAKADIRARVGVLFQDPARYEMLVRESVAMGRPGEAVADDAVERALRAAHADGVAASAGGLDGQLGRRFPNGRELSGGQWQRLALARLHLRDADLWILDEPTSAMDPEAEAMVFAELRAHLGGSTALLISHRFSTVRSADRIVVLEGGRVIEDGAHEELLTHGGRYADLFTAQAAAYR